MKKNVISGCDPERLSAYADGELSRAERRAQELHLDACAKCWALLSDFKALGTVVKRITAAKAPRDLKETLLLLARQRERRPGRKRRPA